MSDYGIHVLANLRHLVSVGLVVGSILLTGLSIVLFVIMMDEDLKPVRYWCKILLAGDVILLLICSLGFIFLP